MRPTKLLFLVLLLLPGIITYSQTGKDWKHKKCAIVLTNDDALDVDLDNAIPVLDSLGFKGSFYLSTYFPGFHNRIADWKKVAQHGHELGNHTLFHPCIGNTAGREWVKPENDLSKYTVKRMTDEMRMNNIVLQTLDGKTRRTFAYPCGDTRIGDSFYLDKKDFIAARTTEPVFPKLNEIKDLYTIGCYAVNGQSGDELIAQVKKAIENNTLVVFLFHGVGGGHNLNVSLEAHSQLLHFLKQHEKEIWVTTFMEVADWVTYSTHR